jgi:pyruvate kinase
VKKEKPMTKTKIVCTIGPACQDEETLMEMARAGMDVARLNFSHGDHESHRRTFGMIRRVAARFGSPIGILQDLCGPKIRLGEIPGDGFELKEGDVAALTGKEVQCTPARLHVSYERLAQDLLPGEPVLIDDGLVQLTVEKVEGDDVLCRVTTGGIVKSRKGVNMPVSALSISAITEKDRDDLKLGMELGVDFVALSFVRKAADIQELRRLQEEGDCSIPIIAKIEKQEALANLEEILTVADGAMVARGDLGIETPIERVPLIQKEIIRMCNRMAKPVITATQMLDSMMRNPIPTRAEVTDIANAILDGTDAVMLSGETASGKFPVLAVRTMDKICLSTESLLEKEWHRDYPSRRNVVDSISEATCRISGELDARGMIVLTDSGRTARQVSRYKPKAPILAVTYSDETVHRLKLSWGVFPLKAGQTPDTDKMLENATRAALESGIVKAGDLVVTTAGIPAMVKGSTNMIKVEVLGHVFLRGTGAGPKNSVTGKVCVASTAGEALNCLEKGDILVSRRLDDSFVEIARRPAGIITQEGGEGSYGEYFCQKYGIPGILGVPNAIQAFYSGQILTMEPERGIIYGAK